VSRRAARVAAVEILYGAGVREIDVAEVVAERANADPYTERLVRQVIVRLDALDELIRAHSIDWEPERMSPVDLNVLRVGVLELLEGDVPPAAVIDEAVDIAKHFSGDNAGRFVNGVLAAILGDLQSADGGGGSGGLGGDSSGSAGLSAPGA
jgi:N utilization substance protein B